jgi:hypothetical protein
MFKWIGRAIDWLLDKMWVLVCVLVVYGTLSACAPMTMETSPRVVRISPRAANNLAFLYRNVQEGVGGKEFAYCVYGNRTADTLSVRHVDLPAMDGKMASDTSVSYTPHCSGYDFLGYGHSHPPGYACSFSDQDWLTFRGAIRVRYSFLTCDRYMMIAYVRIQIPREQ